ncbi:MAG: DNA polymerase III subunit epsilon [Pseudomonadota bacterium]
MREIVFDTETTGFEPGLNGGDRMVEIGCIEMIDRIETGRTFHCYFNPERPMSAAAEEVHGLGDAFLADKPLFAGKAEELLAFIGDADLVAHNAAFDFKFLNAELEWAGHDPVSYDRMVDTLAIARAKHSGAKLSLDALCTRYGIDRSQRVKHGALLDAELLTQVYIELTGGRQIGLGLDSAAEAPVDTALTATSCPTKPVRPPRPHHASDAERERHRAFLDKIDQPLWAKLEAHIVMRADAPTAE